MRVQNRSITTIKIRIRITELHATYMFHVAKWIVNSDLKFPHSDVVLVSLQWNNVQISAIYTQLYEKW